MDSPQGRLLRPAGVSVSVSDKLEETDMDDLTDCLPCGGAPNPEIIIFRFGT